MVVNDGAAVRKLRLAPLMLLAVFEICCKTCRVQHCIKFDAFLKGSD